MSLAPPATLQPQGTPSPTTCKVLSDHYLDILICSGFREMNHQTVYMHVKQRVAWVVRMSGPHDVHLLLNCPWHSAAQGLFRCKHLTFRCGHLQHSQYAFTPLNLFMLPLLCQRCQCRWCCVLRSDSCSTPARHHGLLPCSWTAKTLKRGISSSLKARTSSASRKTWYNGNCCRCLPQA